MIIKIGIVGASFAKAAFLPAFKYIEGVEVIAISSSRIESAKKKYSPIQKTLFH